MTEKDYIAIAAKIKGLRTSVADFYTDGYSDSTASLEAVPKACVAEAIARVFADDNPNFDCVRFLAACYPTVVQHEIRTLL